MGIRHPLLFGIVVSLLVLIPNNDASSISNEFQIYQNEAIGLTVSYPSDFIVPDAEFIPGMVAGYASPEKQINFNIIFEYSPVKGSIEDFAQPIIDDTRLEFNNFQLVESEAISVAGVPSWKFVYTTTDLGFNAEAMQIYTLKNEAAYIFTFLTPSERFDENLPIMQEMINSIEISSVNVPTLSDKNSDYKYKIKYPENWTVLEEKTNNYYFKFFYSPFSSLDDTIPGFVAVAIEELPKEMTLDEYQETAMQVLKSDMRNFKLIESKPSKLGGLDSNQIVVTGKIVNPFLEIPYVDHPVLDLMNLALSEEIDAKIILNIAVHGKSAYIISFTDSPDDFDTFLQEGQKIIDSFELEGVQITPAATIPDWIRNNAEWWAQGAISDSDFTSGIQFLIKDGIIQIPETVKSSTGESTQEIPSWIKNNADWWSQGLISDDDFVKGIQFLVEQGIILV